MVEDPPTLKRRTLKESPIDAWGLGAIALGLASLQILLDKGQREDWFSSHLIVTLAVIAVVSLSFAVFWELRANDPVIDLRLLGERNFLFSNVLMFVLGVLIYASTALLPVFLQTLMGYSATTAGLAMSPGGIVTMVTMPLVGYLLTKVQPRYVMGVGLGIMGCSLAYMGKFNLSIDYRTAMISRVIQMAGVGMLWVAINATAYSFMKPEKSTQASGILNLSRNLGGGVGIALVTTMQARMAQAHQDILSGHLTVLNPVYTSRVAQIAQTLIAKGVDAARATTFAPAMVYQELTRQSDMLGYKDVFWFMAMVSFASLSVLLFLKKSDPSKAHVSME
jgi:DHA2 family multidrug resistance protein